MALTAKVLFFVLCQLALSSNAADVSVSTRSGVVIGSDYLRSRQGNVIYSFTGIPYAQPPIGKLRFKETLPVEPWQTPFNATRKCPVCAQVKRLGSTKGKLEILGQEDCLRLNIYSPKLDAVAKLPVMLFIHGGAYKMLSTMVEPEFMVGDVVLIDITYRLGALGFATTGDGAIPGNLGLKDEVLALKWVQENIQFFGGDPKTVTVFGSSAGGASTHLMLLSPVTKGLVHRGISMSGTATCPWAMVPRQQAVDRTKALAVLCRCPPEPSDELLQCLQEIPLRSILDMHKRFSDEFALPLVAFGPVIEEPSAQNAFITSDPSSIKSDLPWMTGITAAEHLGFPRRFIDAVERNDLNLTEQLDNYLFNWLSDGFQVPRDRIVSMANKIKQFYFGDNPINKETLVKMDDMMGDGWFLRGLINDVSKYEGNTFLYYYDYPQSDNATFFSYFGYGLDKGKHVGHMDGLLSLFPLASFFPSRSMSEMDLDVSEKMVSLWTHFAKYGNFTTNNLAKWKPVQKNSSKNRYLHIGASELTQEEDLLTDRVNFWRSLKK